MPTQASHHSSVVYELWARSCHHFDFEKFETTIVILIFISLLLVKF